MSDITRSEAIQELKLIRANFNYRVNGTSIFDKALEYAIASLKTDEAYQLEYEQPELCANCIDRKSVLDGINEAMNYIDWGQSQDGDAFRHLCASLYRTVTDMPSVLPKAEPLTHEKAIDYLHEIGWMQEHDKAMTEVDNSNIQDKLCSFYQDGYKRGYEDSKSDNSVLEDIKAEIKEMRSKQNCSCSDCLDIIDKYMKREDNVSSSKN